MPRGGKRAGAGRPLGTGRFGEAAVTMRIPASKVGVVSTLLAKHARDADRKPTQRKSAYRLPKMPAAGITVLPRGEAIDVLTAMAEKKVQAAVVLLDPWYRSKGAPGRAAYLAEMVPLLAAASQVGQHVFVWGFAEALARLVDHWPSTLKLEAWLTWHFKNAPSRGKSWRPAQQACLHLRRPGSKLYPEHFYSERHRKMAAANKLEFKMGPQNVFEDALLSGFIKRGEQTGYPAQKPVSVMERLLRMCVKPGDLVIDPTAGSGTTGVAARNLGCSAILSDRAAQSVRLMKKRLEQSD